MDGKFVRAGTNPERKSLAFRDPGRGWGDFSVHPRNILSTFRFIIIIILLLLYHLTFNI